MQPVLKPIYTAANCRFAYQLRWGLTFFLRTAFEHCEWLDDFSKNLEITDSIRVLSHRFKTPKTLQLAVSSRPSASPESIVLQVRKQLASALGQDTIEPNDAIRSYGNQNRRLIESYVAKQHRHHRMATARVNEMFQRLAFSDPDIDLAVKQRSAQHTYWYCLHIVIVHAGRWSHVHRELHQSALEMVQRVALNRGWRLASCAMLADHLHIAVGCTLEVAPADAALCFMNNLAFVYTMKAVFSYGAFVGTIGEYDQRAIHGS